MAAHFAHVTEEEIDKIKQDSISPKQNKLQNTVSKSFFSVIFIQQNLLFSTSKVVICA